MYNLGYTCFVTIVVTCVYCHCGPSLYGVSPVCITLALLVFGTIVVTSVCCDLGLSGVCPVCITLAILVFVTIVVTYVYWDLSLYGVCPVCVTLAMLVFVTVVVTNVYNIGTLLDVVLCHRSISVCWDSGLFDDCNLILNRVHLDFLLFSVTNCCDLILCCILSL